MEKPLKYKPEAKHILDALEMSKGSLNEFKEGFQEYVYQMNPDLNDEPYPFEMLIGFINQYHGMIEPELLLFIGYEYHSIITDAFDYIYAHMEEKDLREYISKAILGTE
ncbi:MAG: hypothetical protein Q8940_07315 [Bacteroidota bacterium]|nr:hypothetical protein [Bacteroidota bacterium]